MPVSNSLRAGVIGLGVGERHVENYTADPRCDVMAICDLNEETLRRVGAKYPHSKLYSNAEDLLRDKTIDVVSIASYDNFHCEQILLAIDQGKHIFVEKPMCLFDYEYEKIGTMLATRPDLHFSSNFVLRNSPKYKLLKERVDSNSLGSLYHMEGDYNYGRLHKITEGWRGEIPFYSVVHGGAIHIVDLMLWLSGETAMEVVAVSNNLSTQNTSFNFPDTVTALIKFADGSTARVSSNYACVCPHHHSLSVFGSSGSFIQNHQGSAFYSSRCPDEPVELIPAVNEKTSKAYVQRDFISQILGEVTPSVTISEIFSTMAVALAIERSLKSGNWEAVRYGQVARKSNVSR